MPGLGAGLSMGMTDDYPVAVEEGATIVRVGRALFGERPHDRRRAPDALRGRSGTLLDSGPGTLVQATSGSRARALVAGLRAVMLMLGRPDRSHLGRPGSSILDTEWLLAPVRRMLPQAGMFDFSGLLVLLVLGAVMRALLSEGVLSPTDVRFAVRLTPRGGADHVEGVVDGILRARRGAGDRGAANQALLRLLADELDIPERCPTHGRRGSRTKADRRRGSVDPERGPRALARAREL